MHILIAEDDTAIRKGIAVFMKHKNYDVTSTADGQEAFNRCRKNPPDVIISDLKMPGMTGIDLLDKLAEKELHIPVIIITSYATVKNAVEAIKRGAEDYLTKPLDLEELHLKIKRIQRKINLEAENRNLRASLKRHENPDMIGHSRVMQQLQQLILHIARDPDIPVMIYGESGTGKELAARAVHNNSSRAGSPFIAVNCAALPDNLLESELFGYCRGAFTGAMADKPGFFQTAGSGTLFLDEVSEMSAHMQAKLLRVLQEHVIYPLGSSSEVPVQARVIGASNRDLTEMLHQKTFREDLYYRMNVMEITVPPLRSRKEDIPVLLEFFIKRYKRSLPAFNLTADAMNELQSYHWPGNIRELENLTRRLLLLCSGSKVSSLDLPFSVKTHHHNDWNEFLQRPNIKTALQEITDKFEQRYLYFHLQKHGGNISKTAEEIGLSRVALHQKIKRYKITVNSG
ncbi:MAG: sigma-54 dependent transcriptional regulator [candidate division KSB1 bacterium]|nr:sigma-54 dependent transcriptional regulator [candidate division KSB1 bacterium]